MAHPRTGLAWREFFADTLALVLFFTAAGVLNERLVVGLTWAETFQARAIGAPLMVLTARPYGIWRTAILTRFVTAKRGSRLFWDTIALLVFQVPIYTAIIWISGAEGSALLWGALGAAAYMLLLGRPYGLFLDWVRSWFGLPPGGEKPMSLGE